MKKSFVGVAMAVLLVTSCGGVGTNTGSSSASSSNSSASSSNGGSVLGSIIGSAANGETLGNVITSVLGIDKLSQKSLVGTWKYKGPGCAFTSNNTLAKAGGEVAAAQIKEKLASHYSKLGFNSSNTYITFNADGIGILFESKKILTIIQTMASMSTNETVGAIGNISKNYDGVRVGFDLQK